ncbi:hypothetical protein F5972_23685 [Microbispora cellulosiformans]|uniref:PqqD family protein n=1 Tax=Microbispora cellulosiformans TaxID=2614688 RepID=A0A5J5JXZ6_9ACTN|nr:hypothetical protein [Microbispora cellulosiformans]KAA9376420.1 hypothetical protein F5972_23685 [Microbispora cellulosiformans]
MSQDAGRAADGTRVRLRDLAFRRDGSQWIVGRPDGQEFAAVPYEGMRAIRLLMEGATVEETERRLRGETGADLDVRDFVRALGELGFLEEPGGPATPPEPPTFPRLRARHVRWTLHPLVHTAVAGLVAAGAVTAVIRRETLPGWHDLLWSEHGTLVLLSEIAVGWTLIFLHEMAHLSTARAAGVPGRIRLGTRLQFLAVQTEVSGIWLAGRRVRLTVYLAGMAVDAAACSAAVILAAVLGRHTVLSLVTLTSASMLTTQFLVFMRTDVYFLLQDLTGCRNMYGDATAYARHLALRLLGRPSPDPLAGLPRRERRSLRAYAVLMVVGTAVCLGAAFAVTLPATLVLLCRAVRALVTPAGLLSVLDAATVLLAALAFQVAWARAWWRRHGARLRGTLSRLLTRPRP